MKIVKIILVALILLIGQRAFALTYQVQSGDWLSKIAQQFGVLTSDITGYRSQDPNLIFPGEILNIGEGQDMMVGAFTPVQANQFVLSGSGMTASQNTLSLTSFETPDGRPITMSMLGTTGYGTVEPNSPSKIESIKFTGVTQNSNGTAVLTGVSRGIDFVSPYTASSSLAKAHAGGSYFILTNTSAFYGGEFAFTNNITNVTSLWTFTTSPLGSSPTSTTQLATKGYVDNTVNQGAATSTLTNGGIVELGTAAEAAAAYDGGLNKPTVLTTSIASSTRSPNNPVVIVSDSTNGYMSPTFIASSTITEFSENSLRGDGSDGATTTSGVSTLTRDLYASDLIVPAGSTLYTGGWRIYATGTVDVMGTISASGMQGGTGDSASGRTGGATGGAAGAGATTTGYLAGGVNGAVGGTGGDGSQNGGAEGAGGAGAAGTAVSNCSILYAGTAGTAGVTPSNGGGAGGAGGALGARIVTASLNPRSFGQLEMGFEMSIASTTVCRFSMSGGNGGSGGTGGAHGTGANVDAGGGGAAGGSGGNGGMLFISASEITGTGSIIARGGAGGTGGNGGNSNCPSGNAYGGTGGIGGRGGNGGLLMISVGYWRFLGTFDAAGGAGGTGGNPGTGCGTLGSGDAPTAGTAGTAGKVIFLN